MSSSNCCFLTCIEISQETDQVAWYSHLLKNFPQFVVIHTVKGFGIVNKAEVDVFLESSCFLMTQRMLAIWSLVPLPFLNPTWTSAISWFLYGWSLAWRILSITVLACEMSAKESACQCRRHGSIPGSGRFPGGGNGNPLQYSCLENPMDREAWWNMFMGH